MSYLTLTKEEQKKMFLDLVNNSYINVIKKYDLLKRYQDARSASGALISLKMRIMQNPENWGITKEEADLVQKSVQARRKDRPLGSTEPSTAEQETVVYKELEQMEVKELVGRGTRQSWILFNRKLDSLLKSKNAIRKTPLNVIAMAAGVVFDKNQISKGEATEHILMKSKISKEMSPEEKMNWLLKLRETIAQES